MVYRDRQALSSTGDPNQSNKIRDRYLDNCFLLCINRDETTDLPEIHRLENQFIKDLCRKTQSKSQQQKQEQRFQTSEYLDENDVVDDDEDEDDDDDDDAEYLSPRRQRRNQDYSYRRHDNPIERNFQMKSNRSRYQRDNDYDDFYNQDRYSRLSRRHHRNDDDDDELSVYEIYVPTNTLNRLSDKRIDNNMVLIDYEDVSALQSIREPFAQNMPRQYSNYRPLNQHNEYVPPYPYDLPAGFATQERDYQNNPLKQQQQQSRFNGYYSNEPSQIPFAPQSGPFFPPNPAFDSSNAINIRRHLYSPSQLPQGLTEGQLAMLLQKGSQYQQIKHEPTVPTQPQLFPTAQVSQLSASSAMNVSTAPSPIPSAQIEPFTTSVTQIKVPQAPPQVIDHRTVDDDQISTADEPTKVPTRSSLKESKDTDEKKKEKKEKKEKKSEKDENNDDGDKKESKKDGKKKKK